MMPPNRCSGAKEKPAHSAEGQQDGADDLHAAGLRCPPSGSTSRTAGNQQREQEGGRAEELQEQVGEPRAGITDEVQRPRSRRPCSSDGSWAWYDTRLKRITRPSDKQQEPDDFVQPLC